MTAGVAAAVLAAPVAVAAPSPAEQDLSGYPLAEGDYANQTPGSEKFYWVFFKTPDGRSCAIAPNGGPVGCDTAPSDAPPGSNQVVVNAWSEAEYRHSDTPTFTRDADVLPVGYRLQNPGAVCAVDYQGALHCQVGQHGFILAEDHWVLW